jgi:phage I-like protein
MAMKVTCQSQDHALPEWIRILPLGKVELVDQREPLEVDEESLGDMVAAFRSRGVDLVIDYEHQSLQGERAPAAGWIKHLEARADGLWAQVEWTDQAREYLANREYRYFSPVLRLDPSSRKPTVLMHLGLTNVPAIKSLPPLVAKAGCQSGADGGDLMDLGAMVAREEETETMEELKCRVGLQPEAGAEELGVRVLEVFRELAEALALPGDASASQLKGAVAALKAGAGQFSAAQEELQALKERLTGETAARVVEEALKAGKVTPAQKGWALEYYRRDPEGFQTYVARAPKLIPTGEVLHLLEADRAGNLLLEEVALCQSLNLSQEAYLKAKAQTG